MFLPPVKIDTPNISHNELGNVVLVHKFINGNAIVSAWVDGKHAFYIIDLRDTNYDI